jgi:hypothetical protein
MKICIFHWNNDLNGIEEYLKGHEIVKDWRKADVVVLWNEIKRGGWLNIVQQAQRKGKRVVLYQQGIWGIDRVQPPFNEKIHADKICVWGEGDRKRLESYNVDPKKIVVTGCPIFRHLLQKTRHESKNVAFALEHWDTEEIPENMMVASELRKLKGVNLVTKGLLGEHQLELYDNVVATYRSGSNHLQVVTELLADTDVVVAISESTFALLAEAMDIPVIIADIWIPKERAGEKTYLDYRHPFTKAVTRVKLEDLNKEIYNQLKHPEILREERQEMAIENGGLGIQNTLQNIANVILQK